MRIKSYKPTPATATGDLFGAKAPEPPESALPAPPEPVPPPVVDEPVIEEPLVDEPVVDESAPPMMDEPAIQAPPEAAVLPEAAPLTEPAPAIELEPDPPVERIPIVEPAPAVESKRALPPGRITTPKKSIPDPIPSKRGRKSLKQVSAEADLIEIPVDEVLFSKQYYTMGEVSIMFRVNQSLLRFWETEFDILQPKKNKKGDRYFRPIDIKNLHLIYHLLRQKKYTIEGAKDFLKKNKKADERFEVIQRLQQIKAFLLEMKAQL